MKVTDISETMGANNLDELVTVMAKRNSQGANSFWLSHHNEEYPTLSVLVKNDRAVLHYIPDEGVAGFISVGNSSKSQTEDTIQFSISNRRADDVTVSAGAVVPFCEALIAVKEFFGSSRLPVSVAWQEL